MEQWLPIPDAPGYEVSDQGRVRSPRGVLKPWINVKSGYPYVGLGRRRKRTVHSLVADAFVPGKAPGLQVCHRNGIPGDVRAENLRWGTVVSNHADKREHGTARPQECRNHHTYVEGSFWEYDWGRVCKTCAMERQRRYRARKQGGLTDVVRTPLAHGLGHL